MFSLKMPSEVGGAGFTSALPAREAFRAASFR